MLFRSRAIYRVESKYVTIIFKAITCSNESNGTIRQIKEEFDLSMKAYKAARDSVVVPISFEEVEDTELNEHVIEIVYEYGGDDLLTALENKTGEEIMKVMGSVAKAMACLEAKNIFHSDIKPENIVISDGVVKLLDFGVAMSMDRKTRMLITKDLKGGTFAYLPPEVLETHRGEIGRASCRERVSSPV